MSLDLKFSIAKSPKQVVLLRRILSKVLTFWTSYFLKERSRLANAISVYSDPTYAKTSAHGLEVMGKVNYYLRTQLL